MKKTFKIYVICWTVLLVAFNLTAFVTPDFIPGMSKWSGSFWVGYAFITVAFIGQLACAYLAFREENRQKFFYSVSLIAVSYLAAVLMTIVGAVCMVVSFIPVWMGAIVCIVILAFSAVSVFKAKVAVDIVSRIDDEIKVQTFFIKSLTVDADTLMARAKSTEVKTELKKVYEAVRYSDPMSSEALANVESQITLKFNALSKAVESDNVEEIKTIVEEFIILINDRNKKCRLLK